MPLAAEVVDIEALLVPISDDRPAGKNLMHEHLHRDIREARRSDEHPPPNVPPKLADWPKVISLASEALATTTKDLRVGAWLAEALVKIHGFPGLRDGLKLMRGLHERFWEHVYPEVEDGDLEGRANSLSWMDQRLALALKEVPVTQKIAGTAYSFLHWEEAKQFDSAEKTEALEEGKTTMEAWQKVLRSTRRTFYEETYALLNQCEEEFRALDRVMDEKFTRQTPGLGELKKSIEELHTFVEKVVKEKRIAEPDPENTQQAAAIDDMVQEYQSEGVSGSMVTAGPIRGRSEALKRLGEVAEFFLKTEPHSPVSYLVQRAIRWGQMPLDAWLGDVIKDGSVLDNLRETLGLKTDSGGSKE